MNAFNLILKEIRKHNDVKNISMSYEFYDDFLGAYMDDESICTALKYRPLRIMDIEIYRAKIINGGSGYNYSLNVG